MATDPRLEYARLMLANSNVGPAASRGLPASSTQARAAQRAAELRAKRKGAPLGAVQQQQGPDGWKGIVSAALDNPVVKPLLSAASLLDVPRATIASGSKELMDLFDRNNETKSSISDFWNQTKNHYGFGDIIEEKGGLGNKWLDRIAGLVGDVALDPTTYLTLGAGNLAGLTGRMGVAADIASQGAKKIAGEKITQEALDELIQRAGKKGLGKLTNAERVAYNLPESGIRFMGKKIQGTEKLAEAAGAGFAGLRTGITDTKTWQRVFNTSEGVLRRAPEGLEEAFTKLATGRGKMSAHQAASLVSSVNQKAAKGGSFAGVWGRVAHDMFKDLRNTADRAAVTHAVEAGDLTDSFAAATAKLLEDVRLEHAAITGEEIAKRPNYMPHMWSGFGRKLLNGDSALSNDLRKVLNFTKKEVNDLGYAMERKIQSGTYKIAGKDITFKTGTIDDINRTLQAAFPDAIGTNKVLLDDAPVIIGNYIKAIGEDVGNSALKKRLKDLGVASGKREATQIVVDEAGTKAANAEAAKGFKKSLERGSKAYNQALKDAKVSVGEVAKSVNSTLKLKLTNLRSRSADLTKEWNALQSKLVAQNVDFDSVMAEINSIEFALQDKLAQAQEVSSRLLKNYEDDIAQAGADERMLTKQRLTLRRQAQARLKTAQDRVAEIEAHQAAYNDLKETVAKLKSDIDSYQVLDVKDLPDGARDVIRYRTVAEQRAIDLAGVKTDEVVDQVVRLGTQGDVAFGLSKKLRIDERGVSSALRQIIDDSANYIGEQFQVELGRLRNLLDDAYGSGSVFSPGQLAAEEDRISKLANALRKEKTLLESKRARGSSAQSITKSENRIADLERSIQESYDSLKDRLDVANYAFEGFDSRNFTTYNKNIKASAREQSLRQIKADVKKVSQAVYDDAIAKGLSPDTARIQADVFEKTFEAAHMLTRANKGVPGSGAFVVTAQQNLSTALKRARIAVDYEQRLAVVLSELGDLPDPSGAARQMIENLVMREVLESYKRTLQTQQKSLLNSLDNYAQRAGGGLGSRLERTSGRLRAVDHAEKTWEYVRMYVQEFRDALDEVGAGRVFQVGEEGKQVVGGKLAKSKVYNAMMKDKDFIESIALAVTGDPKKVPAFIKSPQFKKLMQNIAGPLGPDAKKTWIDIISDAQTITVSASKEAKWNDLASQAARRQVDELTKEIDQINLTVGKLKPGAPFKAGSPEALASVERFTGLLTKAQDEYSRLKNIVLDDLPDDAAREAVRTARARAKADIDMFESAIERLNIVGVEPRTPRMNPKGVIDGVSRIPASENDRLLRETWAKINELEGKASQILENTGALAYKVKDIPGRQSIFNKAKNYIAVIDEELALIGGRIKSGISDSAALADAKAYAKQLREERKVLVEALDNATPLDERMASAVKQVDEFKAEVKSLTGPKEAEIAMRSKQAGLNATMTAVAEGAAEREAKIIGEQAANEARRASVRDIYDATIKATQDSAKVVDDARAQVENLIPAVEEIMKRMPKPSSAKTTADVENVYAWLQDAYAMIDPEGLSGRMAMIPEGVTPEMMKPGGMFYSGLPNREVVAALRAMPDDPAARTALALIYKAQEDLGKLMALASEREYEMQMLKLAKDNKLMSVVTQSVKDGLEELASSGLYVPVEVADAMKRIVSLDNTTGKKWLDAINTYTDVWKAFKTTSPRFHIRNALSATFMNFVFGIKPENQIRGAKWFLAFERDPQNWIKSLPKEYKPYAQDILDVVFASGGGQYGEIDNAATALTQKGVFRYSRMKGTTVEGSVRMGHAMEMILPPELGGRGLGFDAALASVTKAHFNYSQLSKMDRQARALIPFWTFMSRNLPLQIEQMWLNPRAYAMYNSTVRNLRDEKEGEIVPQWVKEVGGFKLPFGEGLFATPDIGMTRVGQDIAQLRDPIRLAQNLNPLFKTPIELFAGKQFYKDIPISGDKYVPLGGLAKALQIPLMAAGLVERGPNGEPVVSQKTMYAINQIVPGVAESERLIAPTQQSYKDRLGMSRLSFFTGLPVTKVGPSQILGEQLRQKREAEKKKAKAKNIAKAGQ